MSPAVFWSVCLCDVSMSVGAYGGQSLVLGILLNCFSPHVLRRVNPVLIYSASQPLDQDSRWDTTPTQHYMGAADLNLILTLEWQELYLLSHFHGPTLHLSFEIGCFCTDFRLAAQQALEPA